MREREGACRPPLSLPVTSERWTSRLKPGISHFADDPEAAADALVPRDPPRPRSSRARETTMYIFLSQSCESRGTGVRRALTLALAALRRGAFRREQDEAAS